MQDLEENRIDETIDLYDSVLIELPSGYSGNCTKIGFDEETQKATFLITIDRNYGLNIPWRKISFSVGCFLSGRTEPEDQRYAEQVLPAGRRDLQRGQGRFRPVNRTSPVAEMLLCRAGS